MIILSVKSKLLIHIVIASET